MPKTRTGPGGLGGVVIEAAPLDKNQNLDPTGVFATYYGAGGGYSVGSPLTADIAVTNYRSLHREQYLWLVNLGLLESSDKKDISNRKRIGAIMIGELMPMAFRPGISNDVTEAMSELWDFVDEPGVHGEGP